MSPYRTTSILEHYSSLIRRKTRVKNLVKDIRHPVQDKPSLSRTGSINGELKTGHLVRKLAVLADELEEVMHGEFLHAKPLPHALFVVLKRPVHCIEPRFITVLCARVRAAGQALIDESRLGAVSAWQGDVSLPAELEPF